MHHTTRLACGVAADMESCMRPARPADVRESLRRVESIGDCVALVRHVVVARGSTEAACDAIVRAFAPDPPTEREMRTLSLLQQEVSGSHDEREYAVMTLWLCAIQSITEKESTPGSHVAS